MLGLFRKNKWPEVSFDNIRKRAKLVVIDDQEFFYLELFRKDGYNIEKWDDINDLQKLENGEFDIILLDIQGIGKKQSNDQGFGILKHLRKRNPFQIIIAYSNSDWSVKYQEFFQMADAVLHKQKDYVDFKRTIDMLLSERFSIGFYISRISQLVSPYSKDADRIKVLATKAILNDSTDKLQKYLADKVDDRDIVKSILQVVSVAINIASIASAL